MKNLFNTIKKFRKGVLSIFAMVIVCSMVLGVSTVSAAEEQENITSQILTTEDSAITTNNTRSILKDPVLEGAGGNVYSKVIWNSLSAAKSYYGYDFTYKTCNLYHGGVRYNYYYTFSNNTRCYFKVR